MFLDEEQLIKLSDNLKAIESCHTITMSSQTFKIIKGYSKVSNEAPPTFSTQVIMDENIPYGDVKLSYTTGREAFIHLIK